MLPLDCTVSVGMLSSKKFINSWVCFLSFLGNGFLNFGGGRVSYSVAILYAIINNTIIIIYV